MITLLYHNINIYKISPASEERTPSVPYLSVSLFRMVYNPPPPSHPQSNLNDNNKTFGSDECTLYFVHCISEFQWHPCTMYKGVTEILAKMYFCPNNALKTQDNMTNAEAPKELFSKIIQLNLESAFHTVMILKLVKAFLSLLFGVFYFHALCRFQGLEAPPD